VPSAEPPAESVTVLPPDVFDELADGTNAAAEAVSPDLAEALTEALDGPAGEPHEVPAAEQDAPDQADPAAESVGGDDGSGGDEDAAADATSADASTPAETAGDGAAAPGPDDATSGIETDDADLHDTDGTGTGHAATATEPVPAADAGGTRPIRRAPGDLDRAILRILQAQPDNVFKVGELCKLINKAEEGTGMPKASPGAVVLAAQRLVKRQQAILAVEKPASFQFLPGATAEPATDPQPKPAETVTAVSR
jgi:hypothetical protein